MSADGRYCPSDFATPKLIKNSHYDRLRETGVSVENAQRIANKAVDKTLRKIDQGLGLDAHQRGQRPKVIGGATEPHTNPFRVRFPWEDESAGITLER